MTCGTSKLVPFPNAARRGELPLLRSWELYGAAESAPFQTAFACEKPFRFFLLLQTESAVYREDLAGNELRGGGEEENGGGDFVVASVALHGSLFGHPAHEGGG
jgi:hypothetical protein